MLNDSIESLPTEGVVSVAVILPADHGDWTDAGADAVGDAEEDSHHEDDDDDSGILIVPAEEEEQEETQTATSSRRNDNNYLYETAMNLSLPGTDSLPSDLGSLGDVVDEDHRGATTTLHEQHHQSGPAPKLRTLVVSTLRRLSPRFIMIVGGVLLLICSLAGNYYQFRQRSKDRTTLLQLEQKVAKLQQELQQQKQRRPTFTWEEPPNARSSNNCNDQTTLVDNCWLQAKANVQLGDCASRAKRKVKKKLKKWGHSIWRAGEHVWDLGGNIMNDDDVKQTRNSTTSTDNLSRAKKKVEKKLSSWGRSLWQAGEQVWEKMEEFGTSIIMYEDDDDGSKPVGGNSTTSVATYHHNRNNNKNKHLKKGVGMLASSVAYASLAAVITDHATGLNQMVEQARDALQDASWVKNHPRGAAAHGKEE